MALKTFDVGQAVFPIGGASGFCEGHIPGQGWSRKIVLAQSLLSDKSQVHLQAVTASA
ncbi:MULTISPECIES: hypothetical protein [unclassified Legionella]|uniref:hypothetical protein n=1 Tax=unclassified Legionella TaxID=2622702 RepID=UPI001E3B4D48|nr:hypothetical protein [Legionella sp. 31fI33]MCC5015381.1 hypothetical protein [Legionella sp. 31fI33]